MFDSEHHTSQQQTHREGELLFARNRRVCGVERRPLLNRDIETAEFLHREIDERCDAASCITSAR